MNIKYTTISSTAIKKKASLEVGLTFSLLKQLFKQHPDKYCIGHQIALPHSTRFLTESIKPFQATVLHPDRSSFNQTGNHIKAAAYSHDKRHINKIFVFIQEYFFFGGGDSHKKNISFAVSYLPGDIRFIIRFKIAVSITADDIRRVETRIFFGHLFNNFLSAAEKENFIFFFRSQFDQILHQVDTGYSLRQMLAKSSCCPDNRLTIGIIIAASTIAASLILNSSEKVLEFSVNLLGRQTLTITGILGLTGYTVATILGIWLIYSIFRSGKM